ncbi:hypothetical protein HBI48_189060 [Parastagonospora nodorum]|nr:hypothetical protein HBI48_189060 [Parastagonospora nodorum]
MRSSIALPSIKRAQLLIRLRIIEIKNYTKRNSTVFITRDYTIIKLIRLSNFYIKCICTANTRRIVRGLENSASASLLIYSNYALQECSLLNVCNKIGTHRGYSCISYRVIACVALFLSANIIALIGIVLYNAIKEYYDNRMRKIIYFYSYTIETIYANYIKNSRSNVTVLDNYYDNNVNNILIKCIDNKQQRYNILIEDYNRTEKREDNILTIDKCRTSYSNKKDIEANEKEEETRVRLRKLLREIYDILLREFREANNFTESVTHNDNKQFTILVEEYIIDNYIIHALALTKDK